MLRLQITFKKICIYGKKRYTRCIVLCFFFSWILVQADFFVLNSTINEDALPMYIN